METVILSARPQNFMTIGVMMAVWIALFFVLASAWRKVSAQQNG